MRTETTEDTPGRLGSARPERRHLVAAILASFVAIVVIDFLAHGVFLSQWWRATGAYWRPPGELFRLIPFAYASFFLYSAALTWLIVVLAGPRPRLGIAAAIGGAGGAFVGLTTALGMYSIVPMPSSALLVFALSSTTEFAGAGVLASLVLTAARPWRRLAVVFLLSLLLFALGVVVQNLLFPAAITGQKDSHARRVQQDS